MAHVRFSEAVSLNRSGAGFVSVNVEKALGTIRVPVCSLVGMCSSPSHTRANSRTYFCIPRSHQVVVDSDVWVPIPQIPLDFDIRQHLYVRVELPEGALHSFAGARTPAVLWSFTVTPGDQLDYRPSDFLCVRRASVPQAG